MYFNLPTNKEILNNKMTEERISEIIHNLDDHWGSPPILTPNTLSHILNNQWINEEVKQEDIKKVSKAAAAATVAATRVIDHNNKLISILINEFCKTIELLDVGLAGDIKNDAIIQKFLTNRDERFTIGREENVIQHLTELLKLYNTNNHRL